MHSYERVYIKLNTGIFEFLQKDLQCKLFSVIFWETVPGEMISFCTQFTHSQY